MRLIVKETGKMKEIKTGRFGSILIKMKPETFLKLTLSFDDYQWLDDTLKRILKIQDPQERIAAVKQIKKESSDTYAEIGKDVLLRGVIFGARKSFDPEMAGRLSLAVEKRPRGVQVTSHGGRARSTMAILSGVPEIDASVIAYGITWEEIINDPKIDRIEGQSFSGADTNMVPKKDIHTED